MMAGLIFANSQVTPFPLKEELSGTAHFEISSLHTKTNHIGKSYVYKGSIKRLFPFKEIKNIKVSLSLPVSADRPLSNCSYLIEGSLKELENKSYAFILNKECPWIPVKHSFSFSETRYLAKKKVKERIFKKIEDERSASFLSGIATGEFDDLSLSFHFARFGLQHIMAISGFHFAILAAILRFILQLLISKRKTGVALICLLLAYFIFLGFSPSIFRAFIMITIALLSSLTERPFKALNSMGIALLLVLLIDPLTPQNLGFQFSFAITFSILLFTSKIDAGLQKIFNKRFLTVSLQMSPLNQHGFIFLGLIREAFALSLAVNLIACPLTLYHFGKFPLLSILYNFFFPFMASLSILLLICSFILPLPLFDYLNTHFTKFLLEFVYGMPQTADWNVYASLPFEGLMIYLFCLFCLGVFVFKEQDHDHAFI